MNSVFLHIFENMSSVDPEIRSLETLSFPSEILGRNLRIDFYFPPDSGKDRLDVLLVNDGQDLETMRFESILKQIIPVKFYPALPLYRYSCRPP